MCAMEVCSGGVHMCECDWNQQEENANDEKSKHTTVYMLKSGLVVSVPVLFFFLQFGQTLIIHWA